jgi:hypothetical protein
MSDPCSNCGTYARSLWFPGRRCDTCVGYKPRPGTIEVAAVDIAELRAMAARFQPIPASTPVLDADELWGRPKRIGLFR